MEKTKLLNTLVYNCLKNSEKARNSDYTLYYEVCKAKGIPIDDLSATDLLFKRKQLGLPDFKSVERVRRNVQARNEFLASEKIKKHRTALEYQFKSDF